MQSLADICVSYLERPEGFWDTAQKTKTKFFRIAFSAGVLRATASESRKYLSKTAQKMNLVIFTEKVFNGKL